MEVRTLPLKAYMLGPFPMEYILLPHRSWEVEAEAEAEHLAAETATQAQAEAQAEH
jgi:hypothetical protein